MTWADDHPESVPARWLRGELSTDDAILLAAFSDDVGTRMWAGQLLAAQVMRPADLIKLCSIC